MLVTATRVRKNDSRLVFQDCLFASSGRVFHDIFEQVVLDKARRCNYQNLLHKKVRGGENNTFTS